MSPWRTFKVAWEGLTLNKVRSLLTALGVIIGVAAVIVMLAVSAGAEAEIADQINALGANLVMVMQARLPGSVGRGGAGSTLVYEDVEAIAFNVSNINGVSAEQGTTQDVKASSTGVALEGISVVGTTSDFPAVREYEVAVGRFVTEEENDRQSKVAVLGYGIAQDLFGEASPIGQQVKIGSTTFAVIGVMAEQGVVGGQDYDGRVYIPITVVFKKFSSGSRLGDDTVRVIYVSAESQEVMDSVIVQVSDLLIERHDVNPMEPDFTVMTQNTIIETRSAATEAFRSLLAWGIMNIMLVSVTERTREIGLRQALGARPRDVQLQFLLEAITLSLVGGLVGVLAGVGGSYLFGLGAMRTELVPESVPLAFLASATVGIFFGYYPATKAAQLDPIEALRRE
jgi:putative ABC transport system permease protein